MVQPIQEQDWSKMAFVAGEQGTRGDPGKILNRNPRNPAEGRAQVSQKIEGPSKT